jgi:hypothetical protein
VLERIDPARIEPDGHRSLVRGAIESRTGRERPVAATWLLRPIATARLVWTVATAWLVGPIAAARLVGTVATTRLVRAVAGSAIARLPVATSGAAMWTVGSVAIGSVGAAVRTALIEAHCFKEYAQC